MKENKINLYDYAMSKHFPEMPAEIIGIVTKLQSYNLRFMALHKEVLNYVQSLNGLAFGDYSYEVSGHDHIHQISDDVSATIFDILTDYVFSPPQMSSNSK